MSRTEARGKVKGWGKNARIVAPGKISPEMLRDWLAPLGVILRGGGLDEAPQAYKRVEAIIAAQTDLVDVIGTFAPRLVRMTGEKASDLSDAAGTLWVDVAKRAWSPEMLAATGLTEAHQKISSFGIATTNLPPQLRTSAICSTISSRKFHGTMNT